MLRALDKWLPGYLRSMFRRKVSRGPRHLLLCIADHFEPFNRDILPDGSITGGVSSAAAQNLTRAWCEKYQAELSGFKDADGYSPQHTFFYPWDEYDPACLDILGDFCRDGYGEVEVHLHHRNDSQSSLQNKLEQCRDCYSREHGLLGRMKNADSAGYAFVHGNWCLCNARPDGDWCGVDRELEVLEKTGCYADFTFPSAPSVTQPRRVNEIYYGRDPRSGERGVQFGGGLKAGTKRQNGVVMIQGPLALNWSSRKFGLLPRLENAELSGANPPSDSRLKLWCRTGVHVVGRPEWIVVKLHTHGAVATNQAVLTGSQMHLFHKSMSSLGQNQACVLHYVSARELYNIVRAAEVGKTGDPGQYRDFEVLWNGR